MADEQFWGQDMTAVNEQRSWFGKLSAKRKILYSLLLLFICSWSFFLGFYAPYAKAQQQMSDNLLTAADVNPEDYAYSKIELTGLRTILIVGYDERDGYAQGRSDTLMVAFVNLTDKTIKLLSIPRDSYVKIPGYGSDKINHAYFYGDVTLTKATVENLLGIQIDDYVKVNFDAFKEIVDAVGGISLYVPQTMINWNEGIELYEGHHTLNGEEALGFVRYRGGDITDYDRIKNQQFFLRKLMDKLLSFSSVTKIGQLVNIGMRNMETSISALDALDLAQYAFQMDLAGMEVFTVPGYSMFMQNSAGGWTSYEIVNKGELTKILEQIAGSGFSFAPNVIDDGGQGRYSVPEGGEEHIDDPMMNPDGGDGSGDGSGGAGSGDGSGGTVDPGDGSSGGDSSGGGIDDIPLPD